MRETSSRARASGSRSGFVHGAAAGGGAAGAWAAVGRTASAAATTAAATHAEVRPARLILLLPVLSEADAVHRVADPAVDLDQDVVDVVSEVLPQLRHVARGVGPLGEHALLHLA